MQVLRPVPSQLFEIPIPCSSFLFPYDRLLAVESEPLHEKDQGQNENHEAAQDQEGVVEGKHVRLPHEAAIHEARRQGEGALLLQRSGKTAVVPLVGPVEDSEMAREIDLVDLGPPGEHSRHERDANASADIPEQVVHGRGVAHLLVGKLSRG